MNTSRQVETFTHYGGNMNTEQQMTAKAEALFHKGPAALTKEEVYATLLAFTKEALADAPKITGDKKLYYISAEFLIGKLLSNNLINLGIYNDAKAFVEQAGYTLPEIEEIETEPSLGNGGLGRLAACFLDSIATLDLPGDGVGLNYHLGLFRQQFENHRQVEYPNPWISSETWENRTDVHFEVPFKDFTVTSSMYTIDVAGYNQKVNALNLFDLDSVDDSIVTDSINFDKEEIKKNLTLFLYPDDGDEAGRRLRVYQQYFMVSNAAQLILKEMDDKGYPIEELSQHVVVQINDTHPSMVIPELIRLLTARGMSFEAAVKQVENTCAYTNHTILAEALEKWPSQYLEDICPQLMPIIKQLDEIARTRSSNPATAIIDQEGRVHMAHMDIHFSQSTNGVAAIHTDILKNEELHDFYELYPERFNNKTNGVTFRRWLIACNPQLTAFLDRKIGDGWKQNADLLEEFESFKNDADVQAQLQAIKQEKKNELSTYIYNHQNIVVNPDSIYDIQIKRLHEYKRQQMNALYIIDKYLRIKNGEIPARPITCIFGAKAAPAYLLAKDIISLILTLGDLIRNDPEVSPYLNVVMVENYNVTLAEKLIPAADVSEQISLASKEASGTSNMKFMLNGAVTLGTDDGANVEIHELVGDDNIFIFGVDSDTVINHYKNADYSSRQIYESDPVVKRAVDFITDPAMMAIGDPEALTRVKNDMINKDWFMALLDLHAYIDEKDKCFAAYEDRQAWAEKMIVNISKAGYFSSDRTITQYNQDIWHLK